MLYYPWQLYTQVFPQTAPGMPASLWSENLADLLLVGHCRFSFVSLLQPLSGFLMSACLFAALFRDKLSKSEAQVVWKDYSPSHFSGATGTFSGIDESLPGVPAREKCEAASVGEFWCALSVNGTHCSEGAQSPVSSSAQMMACRLPRKRTYPNLSLASLCAKKHKNELMSCQTRI